MVRIAFSTMKLLLFLGLVVAVSCSGNVANGPKVTDKVRNSAICGFRNKKVSLCVNM